MGQETIDAASVSQDTQIIDFLYIDKERADSYISQLRNGTLRSVTKNIGTSEGSSFSGKGSAGVVSGSYGKKFTSDSSAAEQYDPYHSQLISLLEDLEIQPMDILPYPCESRLVLMESAVTIRDLGTVRSLLPVMLKNGNLLSGSFDKTTKAVLKAMNDLLQVMTDSIYLSASFSGKQIAGTLKASGLTISQTDLMKTYGTHIPGKWFILGIMDYVAQLDQGNISVNSMEDIIDACSMAMATMYSSSPYKITPILIFRQIMR